MRGDDGANICVGRDVACNVSPTNKYVIIVLIVL